MARRIRGNVCSVEYSEKVRRLCREKGEQSTVCKRQKERIRKIRKYC